MRKLLITVIGLVLMSSASAMGTCVKDMNGLPVATVTASPAIDVLNQIGGLNGLTGKWVTQRGSFVFSVKDGLVDVAYAIGKAVKSTTVIEVCKIDNTTLKVTAAAGGKLFKVFLQITGNPNKILLGFDPEDTTEFTKE
jgi:hypothetical protein